MNVWFGTSWGAAICEDLERVATPVGIACLYCEEPIAVEDSGWGQGPGPTGPWLHAECLTRMTVGSVGHQLGVCACRGGEYEDPPTLTKREAARAAFDQVRSLVREPDVYYVVCPRCGAVSHHPTDIIERYCGRCHRFHQEG